MLRELCRAAGQNHTAKAVFESFKQAASEKKVRYASEETAIATEDQVQKLLQVLTRLASTFSFVTRSVWILFLSSFCRSKRARCWHKVKDVQVVNGVRTALGKWSILCRLPSILKTDAEFRYFIDHMCEAFRPTPGLGLNFTFKTAVVDFTRDVSNAATKFLKLRCPRPST